MEIHDRLSGNRLFSSRLDAPELLDLGEGSPLEVAENLAEMQRINDWLGGTRAVTRHLHPRLLLRNDPTWLMDIGTGAAGLPVTLVRWARRLRLPLRVLAVDWSERNLAAAAGLDEFPEIHLLRADAACLPLKPGGVEYIVSSLFLHHLAPDQVVNLLRDCDTLATRSIIMSDLVRGWLPFLAFRLVQPFFARNRLTRHDGALSIRRAYTPAELRQMVVRAGLHSARIFSHWPWRMTLVVDK